MILPLVDHRHQGGGDCHVRPHSITDRPVRPVAPETASYSNAKRDSYMALLSEAHRGRAFEVDVPSTLSIRIDIG